MIIFKVLIKQFIDKMQIHFMSSKNLNQMDVVSDEQLLYNLIKEGNFCVILTWCMSA